MRVFDTTLTKELKEEEINLELGWLDEGEYITVVPDAYDKDGNLIPEHEESERIKIYFTYENDVR